MEIKFTDNSAKVLEALEKAKNNALEAIGITAEKYAKEKTPVDTGRLRNSIAHATDDDSAYIGSNVEYAPYVELGTAKQKANHMLQQAAQNHTSEYKKLAQEALKNIDI
ncbi:MAG: HK97-gp10 family putative phage morphogenesis protein [Oscillospiraceae bacterium]